MVTDSTAYLVSRGTRRTEPKANLQVNGLKGMARHQLSPIRGEFKFHEFREDLLIERGERSWQRISHRRRRAVAEPSLPALAWLR